MATKATYIVIPVLFAVLALMLVTGNPQAAVIRVVELRGPVTPFTRVLIERALTEAEEQVDDLVLIEMDTPGGLVVSMERIVQVILASEVPVAVWVGPAGAKAASAGFYILIASDIAAMAPGTRTGAASVVYGTGQNREDDIMLRKANKDAMAMIRSIAERRGRNLEACEAAVQDADAFTDLYALENGLIDLSASSRDDLIEKLNGWEVRRFNGSVEVLTLDNPEYVLTEINIRAEVISFLGTPIVAYILLLVGLAGVYIEATHFGMIVPGVIGVVCLLLFGLSATLLPISAAGIVLIVLATVLFILEVKVTSFGALTVAGIISLVAGSFLLVDGPVPELRVPWTMIVPMSMTLAALMMFVVYMVRKAHQGQVGTGVEGLIGATGTVSEALTPSGRIYVHGEIWNTRSVAGDVAAGAEVRIVRVEEMTLFVRPVVSGRPGTGGEV